MALAADSYDPPPIKKPGPDGASSGELENWARQIIGGISILVALWLTVGMEPGEAEQYQERLMLTAEEAEEIAQPLARLVARSPLNRRYGQQIIQSSDVLALIVALGAYGQRIWPLVQAKVEQRRERPKTAKRVRQQAQPSQREQPSQQPSGGIPGWAYLPEI